MKHLLTLFFCLLASAATANPLVLLSGSPPAAAGGGITEVGSGSQRAASTIFNNVDSGTRAFPGNVASGSLLVVAGAAWHTSTAPTSVSVTDTRSTSYTVVLGTVSGTWRTFIAYGVTSGAGANTVTVNPNTASNTFTWSQDEFTGQNASPADVNGGTTVGTATSISDSITTVAANALIIGVMSQDGGDLGLTPGGSYTQIGEVESNTNSQCHNAVFRIATTATAYTVDWTIASGSLPAAAQTHSFKP